MRLFQANGKIICSCTYDERAVPKSIGFMWDPKGKCWWTNDSTMVTTALNKGIEVSAEIMAGVRQQELAIEKSQAINADINIPAPAGLEYLPFQRAGIAYALEHTNTLIADEMGLGKTIQAVGMINADTTLQKTLVICPASLKINWRRELEKWLTRPLTIEIAGNKGFPAADIVILNYDILKKYDAEIKHVVWDLLVCDESHYLKSHTSARTQMVLGNKKKNIQPINAKRKLFLTGTPILNRPIELWTYCDGHETKWGWDVSGASHLDELQAKLRATCMVRRLKKDVLTELPPKRRQVIELPVNGLITQITAEKNTYQKYQEMIAKLKTRVKVTQANKNIEEYNQAVAELKSLTLLAFTEIAKLRHKTALAKIPQVVSHIQDTLEQQDKVVVFAHHRDVIEAIQMEFKEISVVLTGETSIEDRQKAVDQFQTDDKIKLFIGSIKASGVGITLTASSHVIFTELDWTPASISQAEDRTHRIGQTNSVLIQHLVLDGSLDSNMAKMLVEKQSIIDAAMDVDDKESLANDVVFPIL